MADRLKPEHKEIVEKIRILEKEIAPTKHNFKRYRNYFLPKEIVLKSSSVMSFGVGGDVGFEKLLLTDNPNLEVELFDPTPWTQTNIYGIIKASGKKELKNIQQEIVEKYKVASWKEWNKRINKKINYTAIGYAPTNGTRKFYYKAIKMNNTDKFAPVQAHTKSFSAFDPTGTKQSVDVKFKNLETLMQEKNLQELDIVKTDIEGFWKEFANEMLDKKIKFKVWATEVELGLTGSYEDNFNDIREMCAKMSKDNYVFINRKRLKAMLELVFVNKNEG